jgi:leucyl aminopeptidase
VGDAPDERDVWSPGPTGFGARLLLEWLTAPDPLDGI